MSNFGGQDWSVVNAGRSAKPFVKPTAGDKKADLTKAQRSGNVSSQQKMGGASAGHAGYGGAPGGYGGAPGGNAGAPGGYGRYGR